VLTWGFALPKSTIHASESERGALPTKSEKELLEAHGYEILETPEGLEAIDIARDEQPDLILMDIRLPTSAGST
jgi:two-component system cell cycle response regulator DivK